MGEVVASSEGGMGLEVQETEMETWVVGQTEKKINMKEGGGSATAAAVAGASSSAVRWESFLSKMAVRVLLVEADDSTRQIIAALLRKCSYRVAAVSDGLKAWEILKERPHDIDLILTEVELPSISGYALLTLITEHHVCKNIPVIMMSSNDSVSTVYNCMLRGAADFLVKPVRKNELRNLWQHVWRKQALSRHSAAGPGPPDESVAQEKVEATAENNAVSNNNSSGYMSCIQRNREYIDKGSDAQSSCTKPELENEGTDIEHAVHCLSQPKNSKFPSNDVSIPTHDQFHQEIRQMEARDYKTCESRATATTDANYALLQEKELDNGGEWVDTIDQMSKNDHIPENSCREAIDLIGAFDNYLKNNLGSCVPNVGANKFDLVPVLDLSLRRSQPSGSVNQVNSEKQMLNHSDASAFSKYKNKPLQHSNSPSPSTCNQQKDQETTNSDKQQSTHTPEYNSTDTRGPVTTSQKHVFVANVQSGQPETTFSYHQQRSASLPIIAKGVRYENVINSYGSAMPTIQCTQSLPNPGSANHPESFLQFVSSHPLDRQPLNSQKIHNPMYKRTSNAIEQTDKQGQDFENLSENHGHISPANDPGIPSFFCDGNISQRYGTYNGKINSLAVINGTTECGNEDVLHMYEGASNRSKQREAALTKFRLKRKDRCFEKKVRYESRKKLAEKRPRIKGQFVRHAPNDHQPENS